MDGADHRDSTRNYITRRCELSKLARSKSKKQKASVFEILPKEMIGPLNGRNVPSHQVTDCLEVSSPCAVLQTQMQPQPTAVTHLSHYLSVKKNGNGNVKLK